MDKNFELLGHVPVDTGQLLLVDPAYIDSLWRNVPFEDVRRYQHKVTGEVLQYRVHFEHFDELIPTIGMTMNELLETGEWVELAEPVPNGLSYNSVSHTTINSDGGEVADVAAAFRTGWGDGHYPVYVRRNKDGRIAEVRIVFIEEREE